MIGFISDLEKVLGIQTTLFDIAALWDKIKPAGIKEPVGKYIGTVSKLNSLSTDFCDL